MFFHTFRPRTIALVLLLLFDLANAQTSQGPRLRRPALPAPPVYSRNGAVAVHAPRSQATFRMPVLTFVNTTIADFERVSKLKLGSLECPLEVVIGAQVDGDTRVVHRSLRGSGGAKERIELADPASSDLQELRKVIGTALLNAWVYERAANRQKMGQVPAWIATGLLRGGEREMRQLDLDHVFQMWSQAQLPMVAELLDCELSERDEALAGVLVNWLLERRQGESLLTQLLRGLAQGQAWDGVTAIKLLSSRQDLGAIDLWLDRKFLQVPHLVFQPGLTTAGIMRRFRASLLLFPPFYVKNNENTGARLTFQEAIVHAQVPQVRLCALQQIKKVRMLAIGRDTLLVEVGEAYVAFLQALAQGQPPGELARLLREADHMRQFLEERTAQGEVFRIRQ